MFDNFRCETCSRKQGKEKVPGFAIPNDASFFCFFLVYRNLLHLWGFSRHAFWEAFVMGLPLSDLTPRNLFVMSNNNNEDVIKL